MNLTHYKQVVERGGDVGFKPLSNLPTAFYLWVVIEVLQVNTASKIRNILESRAWKVVLLNHMLLKRKFCSYPRVRHKQGQNLQPVHGTGRMAINLVFLLRNFQVSQNP